MNGEPDKKKETSADRLVYFAAERTLFSWIRAGLGLMALGFVIDRFSLLLRTTGDHLSGNHSSGLMPSWMGILFILLGVAANLIAAVRYIRFEIRYYRNLDTRPGYGLSLGVCLTVVVSLMGAAVVYFLTGIPD